MDAEGSGSPENMNMISHPESAAATFSCVPLAVCEAGIEVPCSRCGRNNAANRCLKSQEARSVKHENTQNGKFTKTGIFSCH